MRCFTGGHALRNEYLLEENAMLQRMLLQEQRDKIGLQQQLQEERSKCAMLEQQMAELTASAGEMGEHMLHYLRSKQPDVRHSNDQMYRQADQQAPFSSPFAPAALHLAPIPEQVQKHQDILQLAERLTGFAADLQQRLADGSAANTPRVSSGAAAFSRPTAMTTEGMLSGTEEPCPAHSMSVPSDRPGSVDLPVQALAVSRLALQLHQPQGGLAGGASSSGFASSGRRSSCTVLGASMDLSSSTSSFPSYGNSQQSATTGHGMLEPLLSTTEPELAGSRQQAAARNAAARCSVTRGAAAIAGSCASIAAAAAATAAAAAARKAAAAAAMADASQQQADLRASIESGSSSLRGSGIVRYGSLSASVQQRQQWQQAQEQWDLLQATQQNNIKWGVPLAASGTSNDSSSSQQASAEPSPEAPSVTAQHGAPGQVLPAPPAHLVRPPRVPEAAYAHAGAQQQPQQQQDQQVNQWPGQQQPQQQQQQQPQQPFRYGSDKLSAVTSATMDLSHKSSGSEPMSAQRSAASVGSRPPMPQAWLSAAAAAHPSAMGPLHRNLASLGGSSQGSFRLYSQG